MKSDATPVSALTCCRDSRRIDRCPRPPGPPTSGCRGQCTTPPLWGRWAWALTAGRPALPRRAPKGATTRGRARRASF